MRKLFSLLCSIFVLYSATTISNSFADDGMLECQLTRDSPSMVVATMEDSPKKDFSNQTFSISVVAQKISGVPYFFQSCFLRTNLGEGTEEENTYEVSMENYDDPSQPITTYGGQSTFRANGSLGKFKVYCPFIAPDTKQDSVVLSVVVRIACKSYIQSSSQCRIAPSALIADEVIVQSNVYEPNRDNSLSVNIRNLYKQIDATNRIFIGYTAPQDDISQITLGTTSEYRIENPQKSIVTDCTVNGESNAARATVVKNGVDIRFLKTLTSKKDYRISCSDIVTSITSGSTLIPSIMYVTDITSYQNSIAVNLFE